jgi:hypothetical protein
MLEIKDFRKHKDLTSEQQEELEACLLKRPRKTVYFAPVPWQ